MSKAAKRRAHLEARRIAPTSSRSPTTTAAPLKLVSCTKLRDKTGIEWLVAKKRITPRQAKAGTRYGLHYRLAEVEGVQPLRSCLGSEGQPRGGGAALMAPPAMVNREATEQLALARAALAFHSGMVAACDAVCGRGLTPWEAIEHGGGKRKDFERLEAALLIALDLLAKHYEVTA